MADVLPFPAPTYQYFEHEIDQQTQFCVRCGRFRLELQERMKWVGNEVTPPCRANVTAISHLVRRG